MISFDEFMSHLCIFDEGFLRNSRYCPAAALNYSRFTITSFTMTYIGNRIKLVTGDEVEKSLKFVDGSYIANAYH